VVFLRVVFFPLVFFDLVFFDGPCVVGLPSGAGVGAVCASDSELVKNRAPSASVVTLKAFRMQEV
jgi:hypothetical protein